VINAFFDIGASIDSYVKELDLGNIDSNTLRTARGMIMDLNGGKFHDTGTIEKSRAYVLDETHRIMVYDSLEKSLDNYKKESTARDRI